MDSPESLISESDRLAELAERVQSDELSLDERGRKEKLRELSDLYLNWYRRGLSLFTMHKELELRDLFQREYQPPGILSFHKIQKFLKLGWKTHPTAKWVASFESAFKEPLENQCNLLANLGLKTSQTLSRQYSIDDVSKILRRFRECCQYLQIPLRNETDIQDIVWIILRSHFDKLDRENTLPKFGMKNYRPDFGIPELGLLVEVKFIGEKTRVGEEIQESILADIPGYLKSQTNYTGVIVFVYDAAHKLRDSRKFVEDLQSVEGVYQVIVIPGIS